MLPFLLAVAVFEFIKNIFKLEKRISSKEIADRLLARAMQECPASGRLWAEAIECAARPGKDSLEFDEN